MMEPGWVGGGVGEAVDPNRSEHGKHHSYSEGPFITRRSVFIITAIRFYWSRMKPKAVVAVPPGGNVSVTLSPCVIHAASSY